MASIKLLDKKTIEKIAAGEVIERPASIVKELVENAVDAQAKNITIEINNGGKSYIRITDDGTGIEDSDLDLAFKRHSTSKITSLEDLYSITSLGFRGEALSSICHVAKMEIMTKTEDSLSGINAIIEEGEILSKEVVGTPKGTTMIVRDLFYNLPVRKKFLRSDLVESNHITDIVYKIALGNLNVSFKLIKDNKIILQTSRKNKTLEHIYSILGKEFRNNLININFKNDNFSISGYISNNKLYRGNRSHQYLYVNGRYINNKSITNTIEKNYRSIIPLNRFPAFILFIDIDPQTIDVNIHPTKQEIKFVNENELLDTIYDLVKNTLNNVMVIPQINFEKKNVVKQTNQIPSLFDETLDTPKNYNDIVVKDLRDSNNNVDNELYEDTINIPKTYNNKYENFIVEETMSQDENIEIINKNDRKSDLDIENNESNQSKCDTKNILSNLKPIGVIFNTYILSEDKLNQKLYFIDQHAAHERVMYERYLNEFKNETINSQQLITPEIIELTNIEMNGFIDSAKVFASLGFEVDEFGKNSIAIRAVPMVFGKPNIKNLFYDILDNVNDIDSSYDVNIDKIMKIACTKAVKSGDKMSDIEVLSLFEQLKNTNDPNSCPHGRPTILEMTKKDIEKGFLRII